MKFRIENLGIIRHGEVSLNKPLTVFCGPNGTGKTYASCVLQAITSNRYTNFLPLEDSVADSLMANGSVVIPINIADAVNFRKNSAILVEQNLSDIFGISAKEAQELFAGFSLSFTTSDDEFHNNILNLEFSRKYIINKLNLKLIKNKGEMSVTIQMEKRHSVPIEDLTIFKLLILNTIYHRLSMHCIWSSMMLPVERNAVYTFGKELALNRKLLVDQLQAANGKGLDTLLKQTSRYPMAIQDGLNTALDLSNIKKSAGDFADLADEIENELLYGRSLQIDSNGDVKLAIGKEAGAKKLPFTITASVFKTLASVIIALRHQMHKDDLLIIDEPELNLHPDAQITLARIFGRMVNAGLRLLVSTHSDYIIRELNNMIMLGNRGERSRRVARELGYKESETLTPKQVGVYLFNFTDPDKMHAEIRPVEVDAEGFQVQSIDDAIASLNNVTEQAYIALHSENP